MILDNPKWVKNPKMRGCNGKPYPFIPKSKIWTKGQAPTLQDNSLYQLIIQTQPFKKQPALFIAQKEHAMTIRAYLHHTPHSLLFNIENYL